MLTPETIEKSFGFKEDQLREIVKKAILKSNRGKIFTDLALTTPDDAIYYVERVMSQVTQKEQEEMEKDLQSNGMYGSLHQYTPSSFMKIDLSIIRKRFCARPTPLSFDYETVLKMFSSNEFTDDQKIEIISGVMALGRDQFAIDLARRSVSTLLSIPDLDKSILQHISNLSGDMYDKVGRGVVNTLIVEPSLIPRLKTLPWIDGLEPGPALRKVGLLDNSISVYTMSTGLQKGEIFCIYKNPDEPSDYSLVFGTLQELSLSLNYPELYNQHPICRVGDSLIVRREFIKKIEIKN